MADRRHQVLPGLMVCFALRFDAYKEQEWKTGYFAAAMCGYSVGLLVCEIVVGCFHLAQPAMIYLVPGVLGAPTPTRIVMSMIVLPMLKPHCHRLINTFNLQSRLNVLDGTQAR